MKNEMVEVMEKAVKEYKYQLDVYKNRVVKKFYVVVGGSGNAAFNVVDWNKDGTFNWNMAGGNKPYKFRSVSEANKVKEMVEKDNRFDDVEVVTMVEYLSNVLKSNEAALEMVKEYAA